MEQSPILQINDLSGGYSAKKPVLHHIDFQVAPGEMVGLIGLNGAGKSTTMKHILGLMVPQQGEVLIQGKRREEDPESYQSGMAFVPESPELFMEMTVMEHLEFTARAYNVTKAEFKERADHLLDMFRMRDKKDTLSSHLSKGMRQKVMIMSAFVARPPLYIIDEPFLGLDPLGIRSLLDFMMEIRASGASILLSSHILSTIENYCDRFIILHSGKIIAQGTLTELREQFGMKQAPLEDLFYQLVQGRD